MTINSVSLVENNVGLVFAVVNKYTTRDGHFRDELISIGYVALATAAKKFNAELGAFSTYATIVIRGNILDYFKYCKKHSKGINVKSLNNIGFYNEEHSNRIDIIAAIKSLPNKLWQEICMFWSQGLTYGELSKKFSIPPKRIGQILHTCFKMIRSFLEGGESKI